jgi:RNAse (barnase) inhibitor barstar
MDCMIDTTSFRLDDGLAGLDPHADFIARVPSGIADRQALFEALRCGLELPAYFGFNWDALSDCLRDLSWIQSRRVAILHSELPAMSLKEVTKYLEVLSDCVLEWKPGEAHELIIVFPPGAREAIVGCAGRQTV